jgi:tRNA threonylcarbamoyladenosine biosynthesis protein TsaE
MAPALEQAQRAPDPKAGELPLTSAAIVRTLSPVQTTPMAHRMLTVSLPDEAATAALGARIGAAARAGDVVALMGDLGAGKTSLARGLIQHLAGPDTEAPSPTFTLVQTYFTPAFPIWHFDLYRLNERGEARELGLEETVDGLALIEWPERLGRDLPLARLEVRLSFSDSGRIARLVDLHDWSTRIDGDWRPET